ncbi:MAG: hypothetical protein IT477_03450 [Rhodanobacteraceae bacterium]|nr:hypothetical protein [Rhodanobacteraceae bacterium]MDL1868002.1 hypothetical protein [Gammaproteobacteria bacterium PRO6]
MPERDTLNPGLAHALRALPDAVPQPDVWPRLQRTLEQRRRWRRALPAALAAGLLAVAFVPRLLTQDAVAPVRHGPTASSAALPAAVPAGTATDIEALRDRSRMLERWIAAVSAHAPQDSRDLMAAVEIEDRIGLLDLQIDASRNPGEAAPLWRRRVDLLETLATVRAGAALAARSDASTTPSQLL